MDGKRSRETRKPVRRGTPFTIYFTPEQTELLNSVARERHVSKATVVRLAVDHLFQQLQAGGIRLTLGIKEPGLNGS